MTPYLKLLSSAYVHSTSCFFSQTLPKLRLFSLCPHICLVKGTFYILTLNRDIIRLLIYFEFICLKMSSPVDNKLFKSRCHVLFTNIYISKHNTYHLILNKCSWMTKNPSPLSLNSNNNLELSVPFFPEIFYF